MSLSLEKVADKVRQLPPIPAVVMEILASSADESANVSALVRQISCDQALVSKILYVANSSFYGLSGKIGSIDQAMVVLGFHNLRLLATAAAVMGQFPPGESRMFDRHAFWQHSLGVAGCARVLADRSGVDQKWAFVGGLLHDVGKLVLDVFFHADFQRVLEYRNDRDCDMLEAEREVLGIDHTTIGYEVAKQCKFPSQIQLAIRDHHHPCDAGTAGLADCVHLANVLCHALDIGHSGYEFVPPPSPQAWQRSGLDDSALQACLEQIGKASARDPIQATI